MRWGRALRWSSLLEAQRPGLRAKSGSHGLQALLGLQLQGQSGANAAKAASDTCSALSSALLGRLKPLA
jgi:hypothetical protein